MGKGCYNINVLLLFIWIRIQNSLQNIKRIIKKKKSKQVARNRLQLKVSIEDVKWLVFQDDFLELIKLLASYNKDVGAIVLENALQNAQYVKIGDSKFFIIVDEARNDFILELFIYLVHVRDTISLALEKAICEVLLHHCLNVDDIHGQGYDGVSNMHGEWNDLQAQHDQLRDIEASHIAELIDSSEFEIGKGKNQVGTIQCPRNTQWGSHLAYLNSLMRIFDCNTPNPFKKMKQKCENRGHGRVAREVNGIYDAMTSIEFIFIFHFMIEMPRIIDDLCQVLQYKSQDILNAMQLVLSTNTLIQKFREHGLDLLFEEVKLFCKAHEIEVPNLSSPIVELPVISFGLDLRDNYKTFWVEDICKLMNDFYQENFTEQEKLHRKIQLKHFQCNIPYPCLTPGQDTSLKPSRTLFTLIVTQNSHYFTALLSILQSLQNGHIRVFMRSSFTKKALTIVEFCQVLAKTNKSSMYPLFDRIMHLVLTLRMLCNRIEDDFLSTDLVAYVEKEIARDFSIDSIIDEFDLMKKRRVQFKMLSIEK
ncbi:hypothetical protein V6Z12_A01G172700 [Gossypium hirsutum]